MTIYVSDRPAPDIPNVPLHQYVLTAGATRDSAPAISSVTGGTLTYAELRDGVQKLAGGLAALGIGAGDVVAVFCPNSELYPLVAHGILWSGAVMTPINSMLGGAEAAKQLRDADARLVIAHEDLLDVAAAAAAELEVPPPVFSLGAARGEARAFEALMADGPAAAAEPDAATEVALLPYSSGTTGLSKGVMLTHRNLVSVIEHVAAVHPVGPDDVILAILPFFHIYGFTMTMNLPLSRGAHVVTMARFDLEQMLTAIEEHGVTRAYIAPPILLAMVNDEPTARGYDLSSLRTVICGAAPLDEALALRAEKILGCPVRQGYGMTEASPTTHLTYDDEAAESTAGSVGKALPGTECRIVDPETGVEDPSSPDHGELWIRGGQVMLGYLGREDATRETLTPDGWLKTGDVARVEPNGHFWIVDRTKELIKYKGYQVAPAELEAVLLEHPAVRDAAVVPSLREDGEEVPKAFVALDPDATLEADELMDWFASKVAPYKRIRECEFIDEIPKSPSGKILRRLLRDRQDQAPGGGGVQR